MSYLEIKRHLDKPDEMYECELMKQSGGYALVRYVHEESGKVGDVRFEVGSTTFAYYETGCGYVVWKMCGVDDALKGFLFHICKALEVRKDEVEYQDLLLDLWFDPDGRMEVLDREDVAAFRSDGALKESDVDWISTQEREIVDKREEIISKLDKLLIEVAEKQTADRQ